MPQPKQLAEELRRRLGGRRYESANTSGTLRMSNLLSHWPLALQRTSCALLVVRLAQKPRLRALAGKRREGDLSRASQAPGQPPGPQQRKASVAPNASQRDPERVLTHKCRFSPAAQHLPGFLCHTVLTLCCALLLLSVCSRPSIGQRRLQHIAMSSWTGEMQLHLVHWPSASPRHGLQQKPALSDLPEHKLASTSAKRYEFIHFCRRSCAQKRPEQGYARLPACRGRCPRPRVQQWTLPSNPNYATVLGCHLTQHITTLTHLR